MLLTFQDLPVSIILILPTMSFFARHKTGQGNDETQHQRWNVSMLKQILLTGTIRRI